jgi:RNA polymerase sigma factor (sigma-70 family)
MPDDDSFQSSSSEGTGGLFPHTRWTLIANVQQEEDSDVKQRALAELCRIYWYPIYIFLRKKGKTKEDAEDLTQGLFARMLQHESFSAASQELGRLRSYLLKAASAMMAEDWRRATAQKRGGTDVLLSIEVEMAEKRFQNEPSTSISPEKLFDKNWALVLLKEVEERLREDYERRGKADLFEALRPYIAGKNSDTGPGSYTAIAATLGTTVAAVKAQMQRVREKFREFTREEVAATLSDQADVDAEMQHLYAALR